MPNEGNAASDWGVFAFSNGFGSIQDTLRRTLSLSGLRQADHSMKCHGAKTV